MRVDWNRHAPLGLDGEREVKWTAAGLGVCSLWSLGGFIGRFFRALDNLYHHFPFNRKELIPGAVMEEYFVLMGGTGIPFLILSLCMAVLAGYHYWYHRQGAMPVYLMRRLPNRWEYHRRCLSVPVAAVVASLALMGLIAIVTYGIYIICTPAGCLPG